jgi:hypothetical protein
MPLIREHIVMGAAGVIIGSLLAMQTSSAPNVTTGPTTTQDAEPRPCPLRAGSTHSTKEHVMSEPPGGWVDQVLADARQRGFPLVSVEGIQERARRVMDSDLSNYYIQVPLSLLAWVGRHRSVWSRGMGSNGWRWMCQVQDLEKRGECNTVGEADSEHQAVADLGEHLKTEHGAIPTKEA